MTDGCDEWLEIGKSEEVPLAAEMDIVAGPCTMRLCKEGNATMLDPALMLW
jgi:hypothetical protein